MRDSFKLICLGSAKRLTRDGSGSLFPEVTQPDKWNGI